MNTHRNARLATTLACVASACLIDHFACDHVNSLFRLITLIVLNVALFALAIWHFRKAWIGTAILIISLMTMPFKGVAQEPEQDAQPQAILCWIVGGAIIIGGIYAAYKIYRCAKCNLNPPPPPTNAPPSKPGEWDMAPIKSVPIRTRTATTSWANLPAIDFAIDDSVTASNWVDWQGNPITYCFGGTITNFGCNGTNYAYKRSTNLLTWIPTTLTVTGWVSQVNGMDSNQVFITYHNGKPFATNWARVENMTNAVSLGSVGTIPIDLSKPQEFFKLVPLEASAQ